MVMVQLLLSLPVGIAIAGTGIVWLRRCRNLRQAGWASSAMSLVFAAYFVAFHDWLPCEPEGLCAQAIDSLELITATKCDAAPGCGLANVVLVPMALMPIVLFAVFALARLLEVTSSESVQAPDGSGRNWPRG